MPHSEEVHHQEAAVERATCRRCKRPLIAEEARALGIGPTCLGKERREQTQPVVRGPEAQTSIDPRAVYEFQVIDRVMVVREIYDENTPPIRSIVHATVADLESAYGQVLTPGLLVRDVDGGFFQVLFSPDRRVIGIKPIEAVEERTAIEAVNHRVFGDNTYG